MNAVVKAPSRTSLEPSTLGEAMTFAGMLARSSMVPRDFQGKPENVLVAIQWGREIGLGPLQALQNIAVINGRPSVWGDAMLALVRGSGMCAYVKETLEGEGDNMKAVCRVMRKDQDGEIVGEFSVADAKKAGLWSKTGPWTQYPKRMLQMRARGFAIRDGFPDVLRGVITAEEAADIPADAFRGTTIEASAERGRVLGAGDVIGDEIPERVMNAPAPKKQTTREWLDALDAELQAAADGNAVDAIIARLDVQTALDRLTNGALAQLREMIEVAIARTGPAADEDTFPGDLPSQDAA